MAVLVSRTTMADWLAPGSVAQIPTPTAATPARAEATVAILLAVSHCETANIHPRTATTTHVTTNTTRFNVISSSSLRLSRDGSALAEPVIYGNPCHRHHKHVCILCPMLQISPKMRVRLDDLEENLQARRKRAEAEKWLGEIDGIDLTLTFLRAKRDEALRFIRRGPVDLGLPHPRPPEA
ncbi:hypothetical protein ACFV90_41150 [Streptomyces sp. NPDC059904]|uniref:hypothetical protein n=1 Tax=Streptomyces sp. NPDC059904 TaxID=3346996 RepID=UPI003657C2F0